MMMTFTRKRSLSLGSRYRCLLTFAVLLPALLSGIATARARALIYDWADKKGTVQGTVEVGEKMAGGEIKPSSLMTVTLKAGETKRYYLRLSKPLPIDPETNMRQEGWWVRIHVNGAVRINGLYDPDDPANGNPARDDSISWVPSVGWQFDPHDWDEGEDKSQWRGVTIKAHKDLDTPVTITHDVLDKQAECPENLKGLGKLFVSTIGTDPPPPPPLLPSAVAPTVTIGTVASVADDATLDLTAVVAGGTYDTDTYEWAVVFGGGSITGTGATATYMPPDVATETAVEVRVTVTARGTGTTAREGTSDTETDTEPFTVIQAGTDPLDTEGHGGNNGGNNLVDGNTGTPGGGGTGQPRQLSSDATLQNLELKDGENDVPLDPAFTSDNTKYAASVESHVTQVTVTPTPTHPQAQVTYLDQNNRVLTDASDSDNGFQVETVAGDTVINVKVTAEDGSTMKTYTVTVTRPPSSDATLRDLVLSHGTNVVPLTPGFMPETKAYTANGPSAVTQVTVTPTPNHAGAQIMYLDGDDRMLTDANDGEHGFQVDVAPGDTVIRVKVTAEDGTMETYMVTVTRLPSSDATLRDLVVSHGTNVVRLSPRFRPGTMMYRTEVDSTVTQVTVTPMPNHAGAQVMYLDGDDRMLTDANNTERGFQVELPVVGDNVIKVKVTAERRRHDADVYGDRDAGGGAGAEP